MEAEMERDYEALADAAERGELIPDPATIRRGSSVGLQMLMDASGATTMEELTRLTTGRS